MRGCNVVFVADQCKDFILQEMNSLDLTKFLNCALVKYLNVYNIRTN